MATPHTLTVPIKENNLKSSSFGVSIISGATVGQIQAVTNALDPLSLGTIAESNRTSDVALDAAVLAKVGDIPPAGAQRGQKWKVSGIDSNGKPHYCTIPCADSSELTAGSDELSLADAEATALKTALDAVWVDPDDDTITITVTKIEYVNRNVQ